MDDLFEQELTTWRHVESVARSTFHAFGFGEIRTPVVEETAVFVRGVGEGTDIVHKEMFAFEQNLDDGHGSTSMCLRPENTAGVVRALIEHGKLFADAYEQVYYLGPMFRRERPQAGRRRQFHQIGCEAFGTPDAAMDVTVMACVHTILSRLGLASSTTLHINSLGDAADRQGYQQALVSYFSAHEASLSDDSRRRLKENPLRILDYYTRTVFEFVASEGLGAQATVAAGGRYDGLVETLGGRPTPAVGFAAGIERLVLMLEAKGLTAKAEAPAIYMIGADDAGRAVCERLAHMLRGDGIRVAVDVRGRSVKAQFKAADKSTARHSVVVGQAEVDAGAANVKNMATGDVTSCSLDAAALRTMLLREPS